MTTHAEADRCSLPTELELLSDWETTVSWILLQTRTWPKRIRPSLTVRFENAALDVLERLIAARFDPRRRATNLQHVNLLLERLRYLARIAESHGALSHKHFEATMRRLDRTGRMVFGWRRTLGLARRREEKS